MLLGLQLRWEMTGELERGNGSTVGLKHGNVWLWRQTFLVGLVTSHEISNGIQYSYASHPCSHVFLETVDIREKNKKGRNQENPLCIFVLLWGRELGSHPACEGRCEMWYSGGCFFCVVVGIVTGAFVPKDAKLFLSFTILEPVETHFQALETSWDDGVISKTNCSWVIHLDGWFWLFSSHEVECMV